MNPILNIIRTTKVFWRYYLAAGVMIVIISLLNLTTPVLNGKVVDEIVRNIQGDTKDFSSIAIILGFYIGIDILITILSNISGYVGDRLGSKLNTFLTSKFYRHILSLEIEYFDNEISGKIMNKLQRGIDNISSFINQMLNNFVPFFLTAIFTIGFLAFYSWEIALLLASLFPLYIIISDKSSKAWMKKQDKINGIQDLLQGRIFESISSIRVVKSFIREDLEFNNYKEKRSQIEGIIKNQSQEWHIFDIFRRLILNVILFTIYAYIVYFTFNGRYTLGEMTLLLQLVTQARFPLFAMSFILSQIQQAQAGSKDFFDVLNKKVEILDKDNAVELKNVKGNIEFKNVKFGYKNSKEVLHEISFKLKKGDKLAIVGESGEGKSTLANLLLRYYEPQGGEIKIDNLSIDQVTQNSLHKNIAVVLQDSILFSGTIKDNINYGRENATEEEILNAAKSANAYDFIMGFEKGFDTEIGERGVKLSGGQKQRLSIARALLKDAPILVLDEATSSLDSKAEFEVQTALNKLMSGRTTIIIAHRLATIRNVDHIIVLKQGKIEEEGSPVDLIKKDGIYSELVKLQIATKDEKDEDPTLKELNITG